MYFKGDLAQAKGSTTVDSRGSDTFGGQPFHGPTIDSGLDAADPRGDSPGCWSLRMPGKVFRSCPISNPWSIPPSRR